MPKTKVVVADAEELLIRLIGELVYTDSIEEVVRRFQWEKRIEQDDAKEIAECEALTGEERGWLSMIDANGNETEYIRRWLTRYEKGSWLVQTYQEDNTGGGWYIGKLKKGVKI